jgi:multiple sugar transport system ATP-binding protein
MTVMSNVAYGLRAHGIQTDEAIERSQKLLTLIGLSSFDKRMPYDLSGGERQRVAIGRAIVRKPKVFLFDEPLSNLDAALRVNMRIELSRLHKELGTTMIYVTHDQVEAMTMGDRIAVFNQGKIEQLGAPLSLYDSPSNQFVASFLGSPRINLIEKPNFNSASELLKTWWNEFSNRFSSQPYCIGIRPEHVDIVEAGKGLPAKVVLAEHLGDASIYHCEVEGVANLLNVKMSSENKHHNRDIIGLSFKHASVLGFDSNGWRIN